MSKFEFIKKPCVKDPALVDLYIVGPLGWEMMVFCANKCRWEDEKRIRKRLLKARKRIKAKEAAEKERTEKE